MYSVYAAQKKLYDHFVFRSVNYCQYYAQIPNAEYEYWVTLFYRGRVTV